MHSGMLSNKKTKIVVILILFIISGFYTYSIFRDMASGSELQPSKSILNTYTPNVQNLHTYGYGHRVKNNIIYEDRSVAKHFELIDDRAKGTPSCFPSVSMYSSYVYYRLNETDERYLIASWYFTDEKKFTRARIDLASYIKEHGTATLSGCVFSTDPSGLASSKFVSSRHFNITRYESNTTSGYFLTYTRPFSAGQNDYFIVYYGLMGASRISEQTRLTLRELMAEGYYNESGTVESLFDEDYFRPPGGRTNMSGPGYPPPEYLQVWYLPSPDYVSGGDAHTMEAVVDGMVANGTYNETTLAEYVSSMDVVVNETFAEYFSLIDEIKAGVAPPFFPALSQYCGYANYSRTGSDDRYLASEWYFNDNEEFSQAEKKMYKYLNEHGQVSTVELNMSRELNGKKYAPKIFNATKYESETTSGYFLVYENSFGRKGDYFIVYYGSAGSVDLSNQMPFLRALMAHSFPNEHGMGPVRGLES